MSPPAPPSAAPWVAQPGDIRAVRGAPQDAGEIDDTWRPLGQPWRRDGLEPGFNPGWARLRWQDSALEVDAIFLGRNSRNRARTLNERTWKLGDICEVFLLAPAGRTYVELHVTPENQRLQLRWPRDGLTRFRAGTAALEDFLVSDPAWVTSTSHLGPDFWSVHATLPFSAVGIDPAAPFAPGLRVAICRYDCTRGGEPLLSSTAPLQEPNYHRVEDWPFLLLATNPANST